MRYETTAQFDSDWSSLATEHKRIFRKAIPAFSRACEAYVVSPGSFRWPASLRVSPMRSAPGIWEMTWSFAGPDGRATFEFITVDGEVYVRWRRIGTHSVDREP